MSPEDLAELERLRARNAELEKEATEHKRAVQDLTIANARQEATLNAAIDGIVTIDASGTIEAVNAAVLSLFGYAESELLGENVKMLMPAPYHAQHDGYLESYRRTGVRKIIGIGREVIGLRKDQTTFPMGLSVGESVAGDRTVFVGIVHDLTERRYSQATRAALTEILENSLHEIFVFDASSLRFLNVNRGARTNLGYAMEELLELTPIDIKPEFDAEQFRELTAPLRSAETDRLHFETVHERKDGTHYPVDIHLQLGSYGGRPAFIALIFDMTERRKTLEDLARSEKRAREAERLASISTLTAGIAHDIGTPMSVILGYAEMMQRSLVDEEERKRARLIAEQTQRVTDLVQTLLNVSRPHEPNRAPMQLEPVLDHALQFFQEKMKKRGIRVEKRFADVPAILGDPDQLEQVFLNLIVNAADAMPTGGSLEVSLAPSQPGLAEVCIRDTGAGIAKEDLEKIFQPFYTTKARGEGNGLGLLVSQGIVIEHGGSIDVTSTLGEGTEFHITLPYSEPDS